MRAFSGRVVVLTVGHRTPLIRSNVATTLGIELHDRSGCLLSIFYAMCWGGYLMREPTTPDCLLVGPRSFPFLRRLIICAASHGLSVYNGTQALRLSVARFTMSKDAGPHHHTACPAGVSAV